MSIQVNGCLDYCSHLLLLEFQLFLTYFYQMKLDQLQQIADSAKYTTKSIPATFQ